MFNDMRVEVEGTTVQLMCRARGSPPPIVSWHTEDGTAIIDDGYHKASLHLKLIRNRPKVEQNTYVNEIRFMW